MAGRINLKLLTDFFNEIGPKHTCCAAPLLVKIQMELGWKALWNERLLLSNKWLGNSAVRKHRTPVKAAGLDSWKTKLRGCG
jgi:hypothetical protein